jgi:glutamate racemase
VADSLVDYLNRHPELEQYCSKGGTQNYLTTDDSANFNEHAGTFLGKNIFSKQVSLVG